MPPKRVDKTSDVWLAVIGTSTEGAFVKDVDLAARVSKTLGRKVSAEELNKALSPARPRGGLYMEDGGYYAKTVYGPGTVYIVPAADERAAWAARHPECRGLEFPLSEDTWEPKPPSSKRPVTHDKGVSPHKKRPAVGEHSDADMLDGLPGLNTHYSTVAYPQ